jgi:hypothetical protein
MQQKVLRVILIVFTLFGLIGFTKIIQVQAGPHRQQPTVSIATVTSSPTGPTIEVNGDQDQINVRTGPGVFFPAVGILTARQRVPALGRSPGGDWVQIVYPGSPTGEAWVYAYLVQTFGNLPVVEIPPTPTPRVTPTIDPTLAAQYIIELVPTRLPTYTAPAPLSIPTFTTVTTGRGSGGIPTGFVIVGLGVVGVFGMMISLLRGR